MSLIDRFLLYVFILIGRRFFSVVDVERSDDGENALSLYFHNDIEKETV